MNQASFTFSDTIAGYVTGFDRQTDTYGVRTSGGQEFQIKLKSNTYAQLVRNLGDPYQDSTGQMRDMLVPGRFLFTYGIFYPEASGLVFEAQFIIFLGRKPDEYCLRAAGLVGQADRGARRLLPAGAVRRRAGRLPQLPHARSS